MKAIEVSDYLKLWWRIPLVMFGMNRFRPLWLRMGLPDAFTQPHQLIQQEALRCLAKFPPQVHCNRTDVAELLDSYLSKISTELGVAAADTLAKWFNRNFYSQRRCCTIGDMGLILKSIADSSEQSVDSRFVETVASKLAALKEILDRHYSTLVLDEADEEVAAALASQPSETELQMTALEAHSAEDSFHVFMGDWIGRTVNIERVFSALNSVSGYLTEDELKAFIEGCGEIGFQNGWISDKRAFQELLALA